jgi:hypothetical protein
MRTISATVRTREEAEAARRRLEALGIEGDRILFKEVGGSQGAESGIFVTVKVAPEQVEQATDILKGGVVRQPLPTSAGSEPSQAAPAGPERTTGASFQASESSPVIHRSNRLAPSEPSTQPLVRTESHTAPARAAATSARSPVRIVAITALLAGLGFALGAALGILF